MEIVPFNRDRPKVERLVKHIGKKPVFIQAPSKYQHIVDQFMEGLLPWEGLLKQISQRTGSKRPEDEVFWVHLVRKCRELQRPVSLIEPDLDKVLNRAGKEFHLKGPKRREVFQEARLWFLSGSGYVGHFYAAFDSMFFWLPGRLFFRSLWMGFLGLIVNFIPGDQKDVMTLVDKSYDVMVTRLLRRLAEIQDATVFLDENIAAEVDRKLAEL